MNIIILNSHLIKFKNGSLRSEDWVDHNGIDSQRRIQDFLKEGSENLKKGVWSAAPEACIVKNQNHTL